MGVYKASPRRTSDPIKKEKISCNFMKKWQPSTAQPFRPNIEGSPFSVLPQKTRLYRKPIASRFHVSER